MGKVLDFIKVTVSGGLLMLLPLVICIWALAKIINFLRKVVEPIAHHFPIQVAGLGKETILALLILLVLSFLAGIFMHSPAAKQVKKILEENVLVFIPGYTYIKALTTDRLSAGEQSTWRPATILVDDNEVLCFITDESEHYYSLFLPSAPEPTSGTVCVRRKNNVRLLPCTVSEAIRMLKTFGAGAGNVLEKADAGDHGA